MSNEPVDWQQLIDATDELIEALLTQPDRQMLDDLVEADQLLAWLRQTNARAKRAKAASCAHTET